MIDHTGVVVSDFEKSKEFYRAALAPINYTLLAEFPAAITGHADVGAIMAAVNRGQIWRYINKPWDDNDLLLAVRQAVEHRDAGMSNAQVGEAMNCTAGSAGNLIVNGLRRMGREVASTGNGPKAAPTSPMSAVALFFSASNLAISCAELMSVSTCFRPYLLNRSCQVPFQLAQLSGMPTLLTSPSFFAACSSAARSVSAAQLIWLDNTMALVNTEAHKRFITDAPGGSVGRAGLVQQGPNQSNGRM